MFWCTRCFCFLMSQIYESVRGETENYDRERANESLDVQMRFRGSFALVVSRWWSCRYNFVMSPKIPTQKILPKRAGIPYFNLMSEWGTLYLYVMNCANVTVAIQTCRSSEHLWSCRIDTQISSRNAAHLICISHCHALPSKLWKFTRSLIREIRFLLTHWRILYQSLKLQPF